MEYLVNPYWEKLGNMIKLSAYLQTRTSKELTVETCKVLCKKMRIKQSEAMNLFLTEFITTSFRFIKEVYDILENDIKKHAYNYPLKYWPAGLYTSFENRILHEKMLRILRGIPLVKNAIEPGKIKNPAPAIILPGGDYSAESLVFNGFLKSTNIGFDKSKLEWMREDARADYARGVVCLGSQDFEILAKAWFFGQMHTLYYYIEALGTLVEESLHHIVDQITRTPRDSPADEAKEHYWLNEYGVFPEKVYDAIISVSPKYVGALKRYV